MKPHDPPQKGICPEYEAAGRKGWQYHAEEPHQNLRRYNGYAIKKFIPKY